MIDISNWIPQYLQALKTTFPNRVLFVGLQGSYGRGEATESSDIDMVVILDQLTAEDIRAYNAMLDTIAHRELLCGFLSGQEEFSHWEPSDLFQLYYDTTPILGSLDAVLPLLDQQAVTTAIKLGACNIYHGCVHNMLYQKQENTLKGLYKGASFVLQAIAFLETGAYYRHQADLRIHLSPEDQQILETHIALKTGAPVAFREMSEALFAWSQKWIGKTNG